MFLNDKWGQNRQKQVRIGFWRMACYWTSKIQPYFRYIWISFKLEQEPTPGWRDIGSEVYNYWFWSFQFLVQKCFNLIIDIMMIIIDQEETINQNFGGRPTVEEEQPMCCVTLSKTWHQKSMTLPRLKLRARYCSVFVPRFLWNIVPVPLDRWVFLFKRPRRSVQNSEHLPKYI